MSVSETVTRNGERSRSKTQKVHKDSKSSDDRHRLLEHRCRDTQIPSELPVSSCARHTCDFHPLVSQRQRGQPQKNRHRRDKGFLTSASKVRSPWQRPHPSTAAGGEASLSRRVCATRPLYATVCTLRRGPVSHRRGVRPCSRPPHGGTCTGRVHHPCSEAAAVQ